MNSKHFIVMICLCIAGASLTSDALAQGRTCIIKSMLGSVKIRRGQSVNWLDARPAMSLKEQDAVRTFVESEATLQLSDGSILSVGENSTFELATFNQTSSSATNTKVRILNGSVVSNIQKLAGSASKFDFETPTATASIRGTKLGIDVSGEQTDIRVYEGKVFVAPAGTAVGRELKGNEMTSVKKGQRSIEILVLKEKPQPASGKPAAVPDSVAKVPADSGKTASDSTKPPPDSAKARPDSTRPAPATVDTSAKRAPSPADSAAKAVRDTTKAGSTVPPVAPRDTLAAKPPLPPRDTIPKAALPVKPAATTPAEVPLKLVVTAPAEGATVQPGAKFDVTGRVVPAGAKVTANGSAAAVSSAGDFRLSIIAPAKAGEYTVAVDASTGSQSQSAQRGYIVEAPAAAPVAQTLRLIVNSPKDGQIFATYLIPVNGISTPGADVTCSGIKFKVGADGAFAGQVPIPDEEGEMDLEIEATFNGQNERVTRGIVYKKDVKVMNLNVYTPVDGQKVSVLSVPVSGQVTPPTAEISANDKVLPVASNGAFSGTVAIPDEPGTQTITVEAVTPEKTLTVNRTITYARPPDLIAPTVQGYLPPSSTTNQLAFTVLDRTLEDEITFYREIDGARESETGTPNSRFYLTLEEGVHTYTMYAVDKAGNQSNRITGRTSYLSRQPAIRLLQPTGDVSVRVPPRPPQSDFSPRYTVRFSIENLPDDQPATLQALIKEARVTNLATGQSQQTTTFTDNDLEFDVDLKAAAANQIEIKLVDVNQNVIMKTVTITTR